ncbi:MAG: metallophosphoesterase [Candidatus Thiodiazotropha taylori]|nr:metallophosphoesterase [Candidatus Thiodiazotropha taylori]MCW4223850.1 metallophosphoesterase [Candidatus Thiodiazotropha endolucinida]MCG7882310.1 metallophosphoesterase [Candidatus Thiodiazotropha taylori]MCG7885428.1 metallophosphoesterase [Candidatus Thiodiazotropha taylori]MCG7891305.1 metallophosphoesterase [Candidatus Thiodiazotropha taylori]
MANGPENARKGFFAKLKSAFSQTSQYTEHRLQESFLLQGGSIRVPYEDIPIEIEFGNDFRLLLYAEQSVHGNNLQEQPGFLLINPEHYFKEISGFLRLSKGDHLILGYEDELQQRIFKYPRNLAKRQLSIIHDGDALLFKDLDADKATRLIPLLNEKEKHRANRRRLANLQEIRRIFGGPIQLLPPEEALADLKAVNEILEKEPLRPRNERGMPGGVVELPKKMIPVILGDLHAQVDNLLTILSHNEFLEMMGDGKAAMVFLGDAVHSEMDGKLAEMESSLLIMDLIFRLKLWFPQQVFYVRGNHDSFSEEIGKDGVPQGLLWAKEVKRVRGEAYKKAMEHFYKLLPYVAVSKDYVACHAAPPKSKVTMDMLVNVHSYPSLMEELTCNRLYRPNRLAGYTKGDVKRFRSSLSLKPDAELFVGHTPLTRHDTLWHNVGGIDHHDVVFSGNLPWIGLFTSVAGHMIPIRYRSEPLLSVLNELQDSDD